MVRHLHPQSFFEAGGGLEGLLIHDLRRSAIKNLMQAGVQQVIAMKISGHKTASVFMRYNIVDEGQVADAMRRVQKSVPVRVSRALPARSESVVRARRVSHRKYLCFQVPKWRNWQTR
jgi:hypothetical protein